MEEITLKITDLVYCDHCRKYSRIISIEPDKDNEAVIIRLECGQQLFCMEREES